MSEQLPTGSNVRRFAAYAVIACNLIIFLVHQHFDFFPLHEGQRIQLHSRILGAVAFVAMALNVWGWESFRKSREDGAGPMHPILLQAIGTMVTLWSIFYIRSIWNLDGMLAAH